MRPLATGEEYKLSTLFALVAALALTMALQVANGLLSRTGIVYLSMGLLSITTALATLSALPSKPLLYAVGASLVALFAHRHLPLFKAGAIGLAGGGVLYALGRVRLSSRLLVLALLVAFAIQFSAWFTKQPGVYFVMTPDQQLQLRVGVVLAALFSIGALVLPRRASQVAFWCALGVHLALGIWMIRCSPGPRVDLYIFHQNAIDALTSGTSPYGGSNPILPEDALLYGTNVVRDGRVLIGFPYPPLSLAISTLSRLAFGDYRYLHWLAVLGAAALVGYSTPGRLSKAAGLAFLALPRSLYLLENGWTDPLLCCAFAAVVWCACRGHLRWLWLPVGCFFALKQYSLIFAPLVVLLFPRNEWRSAVRCILMAGLVAALTLLPFFLWNPSGFVRDVIGFQAKMPFRPDSLSYPAWWLKRDLLLSPAISYVIWLACVPLLLLRAPRGPAAFAFACAMGGCLFFAFSKQAFANYYYVTIAMMWAGIAANASSRTPT